MEATPAPRVRILLDVDGVLNAMKTKGQHWNDWRSATIGKFQIDWSETVAMAIRDLADTPGVEVMWLTTWEDDANEEISPRLGLPTFPVAGTMPSDNRQGWWKLDHARALWKSDGIPFAWLDDDLNFDSEARRFVGGLGDDALAVMPKEDDGLTVDDLLAIRAFVNLHLGA